MAQWNCMKKYPKSVPANDALKEAADILEFPVAPDFISRPPKIDPQVMLRRIEENLPWRSGRPGEKERRLAEKIPVEFVL
jgi:hypothetical protein